MTPAFNFTGTAHLIAPSGFKVTLLANLVADNTRWLSKQSTSPTPLLPAQKRRLQRSRWLSTALVIGTIVCYTFLSGAGPAALRAGIMGILVVIAPRLGRTYNLYTALALSALLMSIVDPFVMWDAGFQLSFVGTLGIVLLSPTIQRFLHPLERLYFGHILAEILAVTLAAQIATLPILAIDFHTVSFIAPIANLLTVPLLSLSLLLGTLLCTLGICFVQLGILCGWIAWPLLWYIQHAVAWCAGLPGAYANIGSLSASIAWSYYFLLCLITGLLFYRRKQPKKAERVHTGYVSRRTMSIILAGMACIVLLATGATALAAQPDGHFSMIFLEGDPATQTPQGEAILLRTTDGKIVLIDEGLNSLALSTALEAQLPSWQHSLDVFILTTTSRDAVMGAQDVIDRYQAGEILDAGMLHPGTAYALWRRTIRERALNYQQVRQGTTIAIGNTLKLQILSPANQLHKGSTEEMDNALIIRLLAPGIAVLVLGAAAASKYALTTLAETPSPTSLQVSIVQVLGEPGKAFPIELNALLEMAHPSLLIIASATLSSQQRKNGGSEMLPLLPSDGTKVGWDVMQAVQTGTISISSNENGWSIV